MLLFLYLQWYIPKFCRGSRAQDIGQHVYWRPIILRLRYIGNLPCVVAPRGSVVGIGKHPAGTPVGRFGKLTLGKPVGMLGKPVGTLGKLVGTVGTLPRSTVGILGKPVGISTVGKLPVGISKVGKPVGISTVGIDGTEPVGILKVGKSVGKLGREPIVGGLPVGISNVGRLPTVGKPVGIFPVGRSTVGKLPIGNVNAPVPGLNVGIPIYSYPGGQVTG